MSDAYVIGAAAIPCGRYLETSPKTLAKQAVEAALADAGISADDVDAVIVGNATAGLITGQEMIRGEVWLLGTPLSGKPIFNVENACASGSSAFHLACQGVGAGTYQTTLVLGIEKMTHEDKQRSFAALESALDVEEYPAEEDGRQRSVFMDIYARKARRYMETYGSSQDDLARVVVKNRAHATMNPIAQYRKETTVEEVLAAREIVYPLTLPMCSPIGDGAAALVVTNPERASGREGAIRVAGSAAASVRPGGGSAVVRAATVAYEQAGIGPEEIGIAEVHDAAASAELEEIEHLGLVPEGQAAAATARGETSLGGRIPVNVSGGLISRGHPVGATGALQLVELVTQLRGTAGERQVTPAPQHGIGQNAGGFAADDNAVAMVTILSTV